MFIKLTFMNGHKTMINLDNVVNFAPRIETKTVEGETKTERVPTGLTMVTYNVVEGSDGESAADFDVVTESMETIERLLDNKWLMLPLNL